MMVESKCEHKQFKGRIIFMSMYNDIVWRERGNRIVLRILSTLEIMLENSRKDVGHFWGLDARRNGTENPYSETGRRTGQDRWKHDAQLCWERTSKISCHQFFGKGRIRMQRSKKEVSIHFDQSLQYLRSSRRFAQRICQRRTKYKGYLVRDYEQKFAELPEEQKLSKLCCDTGFLKIFG